MQLDIAEVAERLYSNVGFQKTTVADIARELRMSPANVYRFFSAKAEINAAVCARLLARIAASAEEIAGSTEPAAKALREVIAAIEAMNSQRFLQDRKLHELLETAYDEDWPVVHEHNDKMDKIIAEIIRRGMEAGEFHSGDPDLAAILVRCACVRFCHPRLMVQCAQEPEPTIDQVIDFCLAALV
ncbi:TetR/AcrR family transcriptional regulator [Methylocapsa acidiphila]|uniref:TetR/AcrR family transcriptional regulator n=1 Tax=Methylocapsa acidiphila TaxID=133552 RepID=UPI00040F6ADD|nr:TetR/AcrR family transcriptional regulator [Methylocapsa acidiphila]